MKIHSYIIVLLFLSKIILCQSYFIKGVVIDKKNSHPIKKAKVSLYNSKDSVVITVFTDKKGYYNLKANISGVHYIRVEKANFTPKIVKDINIPFQGEKLDIVLSKYFEIGLSY